MYCANRKLYMCFIDVERVFNSIKECVGVGNEKERNAGSFG